MKLDQIETLVSVVETGSISATASHLNKTQPAISMAIKRMEHSAGFDLFNRSSYRLELTEKGKIFYQKSKLILDQINQINSYRDSFSRGDEHKVSIAIEDTVNFENALSHFPDVIKAFPNTELHLKSQSQLTSLSDVAQNLVDFAITPWIPTFANEGHFDSKYVSSITVEFCVLKSLLTEHNIACPVDSSILATLPQIVPKDFAISFGGNNTLMRPIGRSIIKVNGYHASLSAIKAGLGWGPIIQTNKSEGANDEFIRFQVDDESSPLTTEVRIVKNSKNTLGPAAQKIWDSF